MKIYIVFGYCGEYEDRVRWLVRAFKTKKQTLLFIMRAQAESRASYDRAAKRGYSYPSGFKYKTKCDPNIQFDYTGTFYEYETVELED